jgi:hypothetical protein
MNEAKQIAAALKRIREYSVTKHKLDALWAEINKPELRRLFGCCNEITYASFCHDYVKPGSTDEQSESESSESEEEEKPKKKRSRLILSSAEEDGSAEEDSSEINESPELDWHEDDFWCNYGCGYRNKKYFTGRSYANGRCKDCLDKSDYHYLRVVPHRMSRSKGERMWYTKGYTCIECGCFRDGTSFSGMKMILQGICSQHASFTGYGERQQKQEINCFHCRQNHPLDEFTGLALRRGGHVACRRAGGEWRIEASDEEDIDPDEKKSTDGDDDGESVNSFIASESTLE